MAEKWSTVIGRIAASLEREGKKSDKAEGRLERGYARRAPLTGYSRNSRTKKVDEKIGQLGGEAGAGTGSTDQA